MSRNLLSVNGHNAMNYLLQTIFEKEFTFLAAADSFQAIQHLKSNQQIEALIVDVDFDTEANWELVHHIKSSKLYNIPVILLASENSEALKQRCYELQIDEIFFKPFNPMELITAVKSIFAETLATA